jgi:hypothetical protein
VRLRYASSIHGTASNQPPTFLTELPGMEGDVGGGGVRSKAHHERLSYIRSEKCSKQASRTETK